MIRYISMKKLIITPTYNEGENIIKLIEKITEQKIPDLEILVVDDNSPDGTSEIVAELSKKNSSINLLTRKDKKGFGPAYIDGFLWAIKNSFDLIIQMDADLSHNPADLARMIAAADNFDFVIGSRYVSGGGISNWPKRRKMLSAFGNWYARTILGLPIKDFTGGYNIWHAHVLQKIDLNKIHSNGYGFLSELKYRAAKHGFTHTEIPIIFQERLNGHSKMSIMIIFEAVWKIIKLRMTA